MGIFGGIFGGGEAVVVTGSAPTLSNFAPAASTNISGTQVLQFDVTDVDADMTRVILIGSYSGVVDKDIVHDGEAFGTHYSNGENTKSVIANGFRYRVLRDDGWPGSPTILPFAYDGNENT